MIRVMLLTGLALGVLGPGMPAQIKPHMPADVGPGRAAWFDISTTNLARARQFYGGLFEWTFTAVAGTDQAFEINSRGTPIGTLRSTDGALSAFNGVVYIQVDDVQSAGSKAKALGGTIPDGFPFNLPNGGGAVSLIVDPAGHPIGLYSRHAIRKAP